MPRSFQRRLVSLPKEALAFPLTDRDIIINNCWTTYFPDRCIYPRHSKDTLSIVIFDGRLVACLGFGWIITSFFFRLIVSPNRRAALAKESVILFISLIECAMSAQSSANSRYRRSSSVIFVLAFKRCRLNMFPLVRN